MAIGFSGIGAGTDWTNIINQLVAIESKSLNRLRSDEVELNKQISDYGLVKSAIDTFKSKVDSLRDAATLSVYSGVSSDEDVLTATTDSSAVTSTYDVVVSTLASRDKIASSSYTDSDTAVGTGTLNITVNGDTLNLTVDASNNTLSGLRDAINDSETNPGVVASILNEAGGSRLILTSTETGAANAVNISVVDDDLNNTDSSGLSRLFYIGAGGDGLAEQVTTAVDAQLTIDGFDITSASNSVSGAISGVTLQLKSLGSSTVDIDTDVSQVEEKVSDFVEVYNTLMEQFDVFDAGSLANDSGLRRIANGFTEILNAPAVINGTDSYLFEAGITRDRNGVLSLDSSELTDMLANDFDKISKLFADETTGFATRFYDYADQVLNEIVTSREDSLSSRKNLLQTQIDRQELHIEVFEQSLIEQFAALDQTMSSLLATSNYLSGQLGS
jgi:flagellar hook-associated protein 2